MLSTLAMIFMLSSLVETNTMSYLSYSIQDESWISIAGSSNVNTFECYSNSNFTRGNIIVDANASGNSIVFSEAKMALQISSFDCKNPILNKDLYRALGADRNPNILIELLDAQFKESQPQNPNSGELKVSVAITINSKCKVIKVPIKWIRVSGSDIRFIGSHDINMTDFDITPPSPAFGLIKVSEWISINFNLSVKTNTPVFANDLAKVN
ncbi:MAG: YceI family protein [Tenuifilaceae bacterium]|jgi:hypothetical protein|nr:YceI family protein [Tenuifilaceae bacterium]